MKEVKSKSEQIVLAQIESIPEKRFQPGHYPTVQLVLRFLERHGFSIYRAFRDPKFRTTRLQLIIQDQYGDGAMLTVFADGWLSASGKPCRLRQALQRFVDACNLKQPPEEAAA